MGVWVDHQLSFNEHVFQIVKSSRSILGFITVIILTLDLNWNNLNLVSKLRSDHLPNRSRSKKMYGVYPPRVE